MTFNQFHLSSNAGVSSPFCNKSYLCSMKIISVVMVTTSDKITLVSTVITSVHQAGLPGAMQKGFVKRECFCLGNTYQPECPWHHVNTSNTSLQHSTIYHSNTTFMYILDIQPFFSKYQLKSSGNTDTVSRNFQF